MRRFLLVPALLLAAVAGTARAGGSWVVVPDAPQVTLPSASAPALSGALPLGWTSPPATPQQLSYPELLSLWQRAGAAYGVRWQVLAAINKVESNFGRNMGPSSAGAIGWMQFMPDTWLRWGTDANGDGVADPWNAEDAVFSAARYLAASGGQQDIARAIFSYNHADWYVNEVLQLANLFGSAGAGETFTIDRMQTTLDNAQSAVASASETVVAAQQDERRYSRLRDKLLAQANGLKLLSAKIDLERRATLNDLAASAARARGERARQQLASARSELDRARTQSRTASFAQGATNLLGAPTYDGGYVFPVGGGPSVVSAAHSHHDYPAVDIAAPAGSPEYALADAVVERAWRVPHPACGLGIPLAGRADGGSRSGRRFRGCKRYAARRRLYPIGPQPPGSECRLGAYGYVAPCSAVPCGGNRRARRLDDGDADLGCREEADSDEARQSADNAGAGRRDHRPRGAGAGLRLCQGDSRGQRLRLACRRRRRRLRREHRGRPVARGRHTRDRHRRAARHPDAEAERPLRREGNARQRVAVPRHRGSAPS